MLQFAVLTLAFFLHSCDNRGMKGLIVAAGYGTRFLPVTKTVPKEMIPLINKPAIDFIIEEFVASGITEIIIITSRRKKVLEDYLDREMELEGVFEREGKKEKLKAIRPPEASFYFIRQKEMLGTGHALLQAAPLIGDEPVIVAYPDDVHFGETPLAAQLVAMYEKHGTSVLASVNNLQDLQRYGVLDVASDNLHVKGIVEKPAPGIEPSRLVSIGRYLYTPGFFDYLAQGFTSHSGGEYYHTYALNKQMKEGSVVYTNIKGERLDTGEPAGYFKALLRYAKKDPDLRQILKDESGPLFS